MSDMTWHALPVGMNYFCWHDLADANCRDLHATGKINEDKTYCRNPKLTRTQPRNPKLTRATPRNLKLTRTPGRHPKINEGNT